MIKKNKTTIEKNTDLQNKICQRFAPSNDFTKSPPKLNVHAPGKLKKALEFYLKNSSNLI